ncbi:MAG: RNA methyltransferase [Betaproteobacteria bacterium]
MKQLSSRDNPQYKALVRLVRSARTRREQSQLVLDGIHLVESYMQAFGTGTLQLFVRLSAADHPEVAALSARAPCTVLQDTLFNEAAPVDSPVGILAVAAIPRVERNLDTSGFQVLLDGIQDPGNLGAILRSAAATGATAAHLSRSCADPWSPKALRGGMGAQFCLPVLEHDDLNAGAAGLGCRLLAATRDATQSLFATDLRGPVGFVIGGEGAGISPGVLASVPERIRIPMRAGIESLNVACAAAVIFYEWLRQSRVA